MASDDSDDGYGSNHQHPHHSHQTTTGQTLSRLSVCSGSFTCGNDEDDDDVFFGDLDMSRLSLECFDADDEELSDDELKTEMSSGSEGDRECYSLPATPPRRRRGGGVVVKDYASENEARAQRVAGKPRKTLRRRNVRESSPFGIRKGQRDDSSWNGVSGESEGGCGGVMVVATPKGGQRPLCMDLEEVKACRDLGFELEHERMLELPSRMSLSGSNLDTNSSGSNSPIAGWRISSPGDNPRDVKARLKVWAQAVALVSASHTTSYSSN